MEDMIKDYSKITGGFNKVLSNKDERLLYTSATLCEIAKVNTDSYESYSNNFNEVFGGTEIKCELNVVQLNMQETAMADCAVASDFALIRKRLPVRGFAYNPDLLYFAANAYARKKTFDNLMEFRERQLEEERVKIAEEQRRVAEEENRIREKRLAEEERRAAEEEIKRRTVANSRISGTTFKRYKGNDEEIIIPDCVTVIRKGAFKGCSNLKSIIVPNSVTDIDKGAFKGCSSLTSITLPFIGSNKEEIADAHFGYVFGAECRTLNPYYVPGSLKSVTVTGGTIIGEFAFSDCCDITNITLSDSIKKICNGAFKNCKKLANITIPDSVTFIGDCAFHGCGSLTSITVPNSVTDMGGGIFGDCSSLTDITLPFIGDNTDGKNNYFGYLFGAYSYYDNAKFVPKSLKNVIITNGSSVGEYAFWGCSDLTGITMPDSVTFIGDCAFAYCSSLTSITIPNGITNIGKEVFCGCISLKSVTLPGGLISISKSAFERCGGLTSITLPTGVASIGDKAFSGCYCLTDITLPNSVTSIGNCAFYDCSSLKKIVIPSSVKYMGDLAFRGCTVKVCCRAKSEPNGWSYRWDGNMSWLKTVSVVWNYNET